MPVSDSTEQCLRWLTAPDCKELRSQDSSSHRTRKKEPPHHTVHTLWTLPLWQLLILSTARIHTKGTMLHVTLYQTVFRLCVKQTVSIEALEGVNSATGRTSCLTKISM